MEGMLALDTPSEPIDPAIFEANGGFAWWYLDLLDSRGDGVVLIGALGLPFLPGYTQSAREGRAPAPADVPSMNVAVYQGGECTFYALDAYEGRSATWEGDTLRLGNSEWISQRVGPLHRVRVNLDLPIPGMSERLRGTVRAEGPAVQGRIGESGPHRWTPILVGSTGEAELRVGAQPLYRGIGRVYHDRNACPTHIDDLGIDHWVWGRTPMPDGERIHYVLFGKDGNHRALLVDVGLDGSSRVREGTAQLRGWRPGRYLLNWHRELRITVGEERIVVRHRKMLEDGPFYQRFLTEVDGVAGVGEAVRPDRVDLPFMQFFVNMKVNHVGGVNHWLLPWLAGLKEGRLQRTAASFRNRRALEVRT